MQEGFQSTCAHLLMEMSAPKWISETVVSQLSSFPFLDGHCGVGIFLTRVLASRWNHVLVWDDVFCLSPAVWLLSPFFLPPHPGNFLMWRLRHEIFSLQALQFFIKRFAMESVSGPKSPAWEMWRDAFGRLKCRIWPDSSPETCKRHHEHGC